MKAKEARKLAEKNAPIIAKKQKDFAAKKAAKAKAKKLAEGKKWRRDFAAVVKGDIIRAVERGKSSCTVIICDPPSPYGYRSLDAYKEYFEFKNDLNLIMRGLRKDGFEVGVTSRSYEVDDTAAYMNSGGECGSEEPYWTTDIVLEINW